MVRLPVVGTPQAGTGAGSGLPTTGNTAPPPQGGISDGDKGDITVSGSGTVFTIDDGVVTLDKQADFAADSIQGNNTGSPATPIALTTAEVTAMLDEVSTSLKGLAPASGGGTSNFLRADGTWAAPPGTGATGGGTVLTPPTNSLFSITLNSPTSTDGTYALYMTGTADASLLRGKLRTLPGGNFSVIIKVTGTWMDNFNGAGLVFRDNAGKYTTAVFLCSSAFRCLSDNWSDHTTFASNNTDWTFPNNEMRPTWLKADFNSATNDVTYSYSYVKEHWVTVGTSTYLGTCDAFGLLTVFSNGSLVPKAWFEHWEVV